MKRLAFVRVEDGHDLVMCTKERRVIIVEGKISDAIKWHFEQFHKTPAAMNWVPIEWNVLEESSEELFPVCYDFNSSKNIEETEELVCTNLLDWETKEWWKELGLPAPNDCKSKNETQIKFAVFLS